MRLKVQIFPDTETDYWCYDVPALNIIGTGCLTRQDAEKYALEAIEFTLEEENDARAERNRNVSAHAYLTLALP